MREGNYFLEIFDSLKEYVKWIENFNEEEIK